MKLFFRALCALLLIVATARAVPVSIRVVDADNKPIAGATARIVDYANWSAASHQLPVAVETQAKADGTIALDLRGTGNDPDLLDAREGGVAGLGGARVRAPGFGAVNAILFAGENVVTLGQETQVEGVVRDEAGQPIAGASVQLQDVEENAGGFADLNASSGLAPETVVADAQGRWTMRGVARGYATFIGKAKGAVASYLDVSLDEAKVVAPPLILPPAGTIKGRIADAQGRAMANVRVYWDGRKGDVVYSDAKGNFVLDDVPLDDNTVSFVLLNPTWMGVDKEPKVTLEKQGQVVDIGEIRMGRGVLVSGVVRDKNSGAPLPNIELRARNSVLKTGADGRFRGYVSKPFVWLDVVGDYFKDQAATNGKFDATEFDAGEITVERKVVVPLDLRDEAGHAVSRATLLFRLLDAPDLAPQNNTVFGTESANIGPLPAGNYKLEGFGLWDVVAPQTVRVDVNAPVAPVAVTLRAVEPMTISGRIVDERGRGVAGANTDVTLGTYGRAISDREGRWRVELLPAEGEPRFNRIYLDGFTQLRGGVFTRDAATGDWRSSDIVMSRLDATLRGRVTDAKGAGVAGARVSWGGTYDLARTGADGSFELTGLPDETLTVRASDGPRFASASAAPGAPLQIQLAPASAPLSSAEAEQLWRATVIEDFWRLDIYYDILGPARLFEAARRSDAGGDPTRGGAALNEYLKMRVRHARTEAQREAAASEGVAVLLPFNLAQLDGTGAANIAQLAARSRDADNREWAARWFDARDASLRPADDANANANAPWQPRLNAKDGRAIVVALRVAAVGEALNRPQFANYRAWALRAIDGFDGDSPQYYRGQWSQILWESGPQIFEAAIREWAPSDQMIALGVALETNSDPERARALLERLEKLDDDARVIAAEEAEKKQRPDYQTSREAARTRGHDSYVRTVAPFDAAEAQRVLEATPQSVETRQAALVVARAALAQNKPEIARRAVLLGLQDNYRNAVGASSLALMARSFAPDEAQQLLEHASEVAKEDDFERANRMRPLANYAFALHEFDAGLGRLLIEDQWALEQAKPRVPDDDWQRADAQENLAWALSVYDLPRALQWLDGIADNRGENSRLNQARIAIAVAALATPEQRAFLLGERRYY